MDLTTLQGHVEKLTGKIKHYLITKHGKLCEEASDEEIYDSFSMALREEVLINWITAYSTYQKNKSRIVYYLSMEYLPGKIFENTIKNLHAEDLCTEAMKALGKNFDHIIHCEREPGLGNGGLGRLASCFLDSLATLKIPAMGYGLRYQYGTFEQEICFGQQVERPDRWLLHPHPWEFRRDYIEFLVRFGGKCSQRKGPKDPLHKKSSLYEEIRATCYDIPIVGYSDRPDYSVLTLRLWSSKDSPQNFRLQTFNAGNLNEASENLILSDVLYPSDHHEVGKRIRLKQEYFLVSASLQDILRRHQENGLELSSLSEKVCIQINDTHPALVISEFMRILLDIHHIQWDQAWQWTCQCMNYTNHTILSEALEEWSTDLLSRLLPRQYQILLKLDRQFKRSLPKELQNEQMHAKMAIIHNKRARMAHLAIYGAQKVNGVAKLHTEILKADLFKEFHGLYPEKILPITNGVTQRRWLFHANPLLSELISQKIGPNWKNDFYQIQKLKEFANDPKFQDAFLEVKKNNKLRACEYITNYHEEFRSYDPFVNEMLPLGPDSLFDLHIKRIHEYKRQLLMLIHSMMIYLDLKHQERKGNVKRTAIIAGKAAAGYQHAKELIYLIHIIARKVNQDPDTKERLRILFIENYNVTKAEILIPGADLSEQISQAGKEASGTGNMKLAMNGALTIGTEDGANIEMREAIGDEYWPFRFGALKDELIKIRLNCSYYPEKISEKNPKIKRVLNSLLDDTFTEDRQQKKLLKKFHTYLLKGFNPDPYFILYDLEDYYQTQLKVEELFSQPREWARLALHNIAGMASFSSDISIQNYAEKVWYTQKEELDNSIHEKVKKDFLEHDRCSKQA